MCKLSFNIFTSALIYMRLTVGIYVTLLASTADIPYHKPMVGKVLMSSMTLTLLEIYTSDMYNSP